MPYNYSWSFFSDGVKLLRKSLLFQVLLWSFIMQDRTEFSLGLWFLTGDHYVLHRGHLAMSTDTLTTMTQGVYWHLVYWSQNIPQCTRALFTTKNYLVKCLQCRDWETILKSELFPTIKARWLSVLCPIPVNYYLFLVWLVGTGTIPNLVWEPSTVFFYSFQVVLSQPPDSFLTHMCWSELWWILEGDPLHICEILCAVLFSPVMYTVNSSCLCLPIFSSLKPFSTHSRLPEL